MSFGKVAQPVVTARSNTPWVSGLAPSGRLIATAAKVPTVHDSPLVAWQPALGATTYEVQLSRKSYPWQTTWSTTTSGTSVVLPLGASQAGTWFYRIRGMLPKGIESPIATRCSVAGRRVDVGDEEEEPPAASTVVHRIAVRNRPTSVTTGPACPRGVSGRIRRFRRGGDSGSPGAPTWVVFLAELSAFIPPAFLLEVAEYPARRRGRGNAFATPSVSGHAFDDADQLVGGVVMPACVVHQFSGASDDCALVWISGDRDAPAAAKPSSPSRVSQCSKRTQHRVGVHLEHRGEVFGRRQAIAGSRLSIRDWPGGSWRRPGRGAVWGRCDRRRTPTWCYLW